LASAGPRRTSLSTRGHTSFNFIIIMDSHMKTKSWMLAAALTLLCAAAGAQDKKASAESAQAAVSQRAEALTQEQISKSHDVPGLTRLAQIYAQKNDDQRLAWVLARVSELSPNSGDLKMQLALVYAKMGNKKLAYDTLMHMQMQGFGYDISSDSRFEPIHGTRVWDYIVANLQVNAKPFGEGTVAFELPKTDSLMNALAWDAKRKSLLVGSQRDGSIHLLDEKGKLTSFITASAENGLWGVDALGVDNVHGKLYVATSASPRFAGFNASNANKAAVLEFELATGKRLQTLSTPGIAGTQLFNSIAVGKDGQVFVADNGHKAIFKIEGATLKPILQNPKLTSISGLAVSDDGRTLYLADYSKGLFGFDLTKGSAFEPGYNPEQLVLGGIVGLHWYDGNLIMIEDGMIPKRVMRLKMSDDGSKIISVMPLDVSSAAFATLGDGTLAGDKLYFVANRQDSHYDSNGVQIDAASTEPEKIFRSNVRFAWGQAGAMKSSVPVQAGNPAMLDKKPGTPKEGADKP
jgi:DNA-binding beta-propeller fold protein YncE